jgi:pimeloyl-ACP methyl ester carboxylesterase
MRGQSVQTADLRMHYLQRGTGEPVVLLHGFPETSYEWRHQLESLGETYAVFAPDLRGFGETDKPGVRVSRRLLAEDVIRFMDALGIERTALVGHDWGGIVAFKVAIDFPERITRLALLDTLCTVWTPAAVHGYWFKAEPLPEQFFSRHHRAFIEAIAGAGGDALPGRPESPWRLPAGAASGLARRRWARAEDLEHYTRAFTDPESHRHAISYYRYALPFHVVHTEAARGERYQSLGERQVAEMWLHPDGLEKHPLYPHFMDYGPEDRHKRYAHPTLWMYGRPGASEEVTEVPGGNPFLDQFARYFPDLRARAVDAGHFFPEEAPAATDRALLAFLRGAI